MWGEARTLINGKATHIFFQLNIWALKYFYGLLANP